MFSVVEPRDSVFWCCLLPRQTGRVGCTFLLSPAHPLKMKTLGPILSFEILTGGCRLGQTEATVCVWFFRSFVWNTYKHLDLCWLVSEEQWLPVRLVGEALQRDESVSLCHHAGQNLIFRSRFGFVAGDVRWVSLLMRLYLIHWYLNCHLTYFIYLYICMCVSLRSNLSLESCVYVSRGSDKACPSSKFDKLSEWLSISLIGPLGPEAIKCKL